MATPTTIEELLAGRELADLVRAAIRANRDRNHAGAPPAVAAGHRDHPARLGQVAEAVAAAPLPPAHAPSLSPNPTLRIEPRGDRPGNGGDRVLVWRDPQLGRARIRAAGAAELLALALAGRGTSEEAAAAAAGVPPAAVAAVVDDALAAGLVIGPAPGLHRWRSIPADLADADHDLVVSGWFTVQWHLTQACDLHCRHCYDRSDLTAMPLAAALRLVDDVVGFCRRRRVDAEFCLTGGNPLLYPDFDRLYRRIHDTGSEISILGNPVKRSRLDRLVAIRPPSQYQVSLEGLEPRDDRARGAGHFRRTLEFLDWLRQLGVTSAVMLTLTRDNLDDVLPLAELLRDRVDVFTFNRLAQVGEGADLAIPTADEYRSFRDRYRAAALDNPILRFKDDLFNLDQHLAGRPPLPGCTGFGCGAAFNFVAVLPDGEAHACRKLPSPIGNLLAAGVEAVWESAAAQRWRDGSAACRGCPARICCGGCPAVTHGAGGDPLVDRDPHCTLGVA